MRYAGKHGDRYLDRYLNADILCIYIEIPFEKLNVKFKNFYVKPSSGVLAQAYEHKLPKAEIYSMLTGCLRNKPNYSVIFEIAFKYTFLDSC